MKLIRSKSYQKLTKSRIITIILHKFKLLALITQ
ncbi:hypothetical protein MUK42_21029 [Musa troglodytarum]|uniref:Uncharacterized protein n=1 Tax=Musa troglodytarum TaxID=320322 RepID=A0A9E7FWP1_9LILI|nr:hypothetical protein MUK42_21029 [Musa troglodytarum]